MNSKKRIDNDFKGEHNRQGQWDMHWHSQWEGIRYDQLKDEKAL